MTRRNEFPAESNRVSQFLRAVPSLKLRSSNAAAAIASSILLLGAAVTGTGQAPPATEPADTPAFAAAAASIPGLYNPVADP